MRELPVSQEYVADVNPFLHDFLEPGLGAVILAFQAVGAHVGGLSPPVVDNSQIDKSAEAVVQVRKDPAQAFGVPKGGRVVVVNDEVQCRFAGFEEEGDGALGVGGQPGGTQQDLGFYGMLGDAVVENGDADQRHHSHAGHQQDGHLPEPRIVEEVAEVIRFGDVTLQKLRSEIFEMI